MMSRKIRTKKAGCTKPPPIYVCSPVVPVPIKPFQDEKELGKRKLAMIKHVVVKKTYTDTTADKLNYSINHRVRVNCDPPIMLPNRFALESSVLVGRMADYGKSPRCDEYGYPYLIELDSDGLTSDVWSSICAVFKHLAIGTIPFYSPSVDAIDDVISVFNKYGLYVAMDDYIRSAMMRGAKFECVTAIDSTIYSKDVISCFWTAAINLPGLTRFEFVRSIKNDYIRNAIIRQFIVRFAGSA